MSVRLVWALLAVLLPAVVSWGCAHKPAARPPATDPVTAALAQLLRTAPSDDTRSRQRADWMRRFYSRRQGSPAWLSARSVHARADELLAEIGVSWQHGLDPEDYGLTPLTEGIRRARKGTGSAHTLAPIELARLDVGLTAAFLALADDLRRGAVDPAQLGVSWGVRRPPADLSGLLATAIALDGVGVNLRRLGPASSAYRHLQRALDQDPRRTEQLRANLERWRWLPRDFGGRYLLVRIADFELDLVRHGQAQTHRVIVGKPFRQTPQFASEATHLVLHPSWNVPARIADEELAPALDPRRGAPGVAALRAQGFEALSHRGGAVSLDSLDWGTGGLSSKYRLRQQPGGSNPLGRIKLDLANPFSVYLHDTPATGLFSRSERDLSHGCVRVEHMEELARQLLAPAPAKLRRFDRLLTAGETGRVDLPAAVPVFLLYWTASVTPAGDIRYSEDHYDADRHLLTALAQAPGARPWLSTTLDPDPLPSP